MRLLLTLGLALLSMTCAARDFGGYYPKEKLENVLRNCEKYDWAAQERDQKTSAAAAWAAMSDEELWLMVPGQKVPRCIDVTWDWFTTGPKRLGCLKCGEKINDFGHYPYTPDPLKDNWKLKCPSCGVIFPTNDFAAFMESGRDERGFFDPNKADRKLLFNAEHSDPSDPLHRFGVDDGLGYIDQNGRAHKFVGYYTWKLWGKIREAVTSLADAYVYTGDPKYARKAAIMLDRIADCYPDMDFGEYGNRGWYHSDGSSHKGKIEGAIWECYYIESLADAYDKIISATRDNPELYAFLKDRTAKFPGLKEKGTREFLIKNIDENLLAVAANAVMNTKQIKGNEGMHQGTITACAVALNTMPRSGQWIDWVFSEGGGRVPEILVGSLDRDGAGAEGAPGYSVLWPNSFARLAERLADFQLYRKYDIYRDFPQMRRGFSVAHRMSTLGMATPNEGDTGECGTVGVVGARPEFPAMGYKRYRDLENAVAAYQFSRSAGKPIPKDIYSSDPLALATEIELKGAAAEERVGGHIQSGFGLAVLESGKGKSGTAVTCYFGRTGGHGHEDQLNYDLFANGGWMLPDFGYPEYANSLWHPNLWHRTTLCHNLVVVDKKMQTENWVGLPQYFEVVKNGVGAFEIDCPRAYPQTKLYRRTMALVECGEGKCYLVDVTRVVGGSEHLLSLHGPSAGAETTGLKLVEQGSGTFAGKDVAYGTSPAGIHAAFTYLDRVARDASPPGQFSIDWAITEKFRHLRPEDKLHVRAFVAADAKEIALADGPPPSNYPHNPKRLRFAFVQRSGSDLQSTFSTVIEPYREKPFIKKAEAIVTGSDDSVAWRIELEDGTIDHVVVGRENSTRTKLPGLECEGKFAFTRTVNGKVTSATLISGSRLLTGDGDRDSAGLQGLSGLPETTGKVVNREAMQFITLNGGLEPKNLVGRRIRISNDGERNAFYEIAGAQADAAGVKIDCGATSFIRRHEDAKDYSQGFVYDFEPGAEFAIPNRFDRQ